MKSFFRLMVLAALISYLGSGNSFSQTTSTNAPDWMTRPLSVLDAMNLALNQNDTILKAQNDLTSSYGLVVQTRAVALPQLTASGSYTYTQPSAIETIPIRLPPPAGFAQANQNWKAGFQLVQTVYGGGKLVAAIKASRLTKEQAKAQYDTVVQDTLLSTRTAYYDALLAREQITVHEASVKLLQNELDDQQRRYKAGTVPQFNVLRAEVQLANERPLLIQARNSYRIAKNNLSNALGYNLPTNVWEDIPLQFSDKLDAAPYEVDLPSAIARAIETRSELVALRKTSELQQLNIVSARAGYRPQLQVFAGYNWFNAQYGVTPPPLGLNQDFHGYNAGAQVSWDIFDGMLTRGKVIQARAGYEKSKNNLSDETRQIELQVRTAYSDFVEAREVLDSQKTVQAEAEEALREAKARFDAGTGTQLDVLDAETSLTQARATDVQALHDYDTARAKLERAIGQDMIQTVQANP
ncbi:MAG TPA: TolC family protein [Verrucomicrobiae bacterium]|jgi:outer membrane protein TolC|nr:TolC family protein [Verrucomicrobiae bacterium]